MKVKLRFAPYMRGAPEWREVEAKVTGDLAVHRPGYLSPEGELSLLKRGWEVSHIPSGDKVTSALPRRFMDRGGIIGNQRELLTWAAAWQAACPEFFAGIAPEDNRDANLRRLANHAIDIAKSL